MSDMKENVLKLEECWKQTVKTLENVAEHLEAEEKENVLQRVELLQKSIELLKEKSEASEKQE